MWTREEPSSSSKEARPWPHSRRVAEALLVDAEHPGAIQAGRLGPAESLLRGTLDRWRGHLEKAVRSENGEADGGV